jgi:hypothetical protein
MPGLKRKAPANGVLRLATEKAKRVRMAPLFSKRLRQLFEADDVAPPVEAVD